MEPQRVDFYRPLIANKPGPPPLALRVGIVDGSSYSEGVPASSVRAETYVLLSALPAELRQRVETAIQLLIAGG